MSETQLVEDPSFEDLTAGVNHSTNRVLYQELKLFDTHVEINTGNSIKAIRLEVLKSMLDSILGESSDPSPILLPFNTFAISKTSSSLQLSQYYPGEKKEIMYLPRGMDVAVKFTVPFPNIIISHSLVSNLVSGGVGWKSNGTSYFCTPKAVTALPEKSIFKLDKGEGIFDMPFPNFYGGGAMCYGSNSMPVLFNNNLRGLDYYHKVLTVAPFNNDLGIRGVTGVGDGVLSWLTELSKLETFPYDRLKS